MPTAIMIEWRQFSGCIVCYFCNKFGKKQVFFRFIIFIIQQKSSDFSKLLMRFFPSTTIFYNAFKPHYGLRYNTHILSKVESICNPQFGLSWFFIRSKICLPLSKPFLSMSFKDRRLFQHQYIFFENNICNSQF